MLYSKRLSTELQFFIGYTAYTTTLRKKELMMAHFFFHVAPEQSV